MAEKVKLSKDGLTIDFTQSDNIPTSMKKFRHSNDIIGFYRFIYENDLQKEAYQILERIVNVRKVAKKALKQEAAQTKKIEQAIIKEQAALALEASKPKTAAKAVAKPVPKNVVVKPVLKPAAKAATKPALKAVTKINLKSPSKGKPITKTKKK